MPDQSNVTLLQKALDLRRELDKALDALRVGAAGKEAPGATEEMHRMLNAYVRLRDEAVQSPSNGDNVALPGLDQAMLSAGLAQPGLDPENPSAEYFVLSDGERPLRVFFDETTAKDQSIEYSNYFLDVFDPKGNPVRSMKCVTKKGTDQRFWTTKF